MAVGGDRALASLLSALAEAPDVSAAASFLLTQIAEITGAARSLMLRFDPSQESLQAVATLGFSAGLPSLGVPVNDLASPLVASTLALVPVRGDGAMLGPRALTSLRNWVTLPMGQPRTRGALEMMPAQQ